MGEIANEIIEGEICQICLTPMDEVTGYPQTCSDCSNETGEVNSNKNK